MFVYNSIVAFTLVLFLKRKKKTNSLLKICYPQRNVQLIVGVERSEGNNSHNILDFV